MRTLLLRIYGRYETCELESAGGCLKEEVGPEIGLNGRWRERGKANLLYFLEGIIASCLSPFLKTALPLGGLLWPPHSSCSSRVLYTPLASDTSTTTARCGSDPHSRHGYLLNEHRNEAFEGGSSVEKQHESSPGETSTAPTSPGSLCSPFSCSKSKP